MENIENVLKQFLTDYGGNKASKVPLTELKEDLEKRLVSLRSESITLNHSIDSIIKSSKSKKDLKSFLLYVSEKMFSFSDLGDL